MMSQKKLASRSDFCEAVYETVKQIPPGGVMSYGEVARCIGRPKAARAVGNCLGLNYDPEVPCHRVIRADGRAGGYNGGFELKRIKLRREGVLII